MCAIRSYIPKTSINYIGTLHHIWSISSDTHAFRNGKSLRLTCTSNSKHHIYVHYSFMGASNVTADLWGSVQHFYTRELASSYNQILHANICYIHRDVSLCIQNNTIEVYEELDGLARDLIAHIEFKISVNNGKNGSGQSLHFRRAWSYTQN
jgi:hypothetical protein